MTNSTTAARPAPRTVRSSKHPFLRRAQPYLLLLPAVLFMVVVVIYPMFRTIQYSFTDYKVWKANDVKWIGLENYKNLIQDPDFLLSCVNTLKWVVIILACQFLIGLGVALLLNMNFKLRGIVRGLVLIPWITPSIMTSLMWVWMYHGSFGVFNYALKGMHLINEFIPFLSQTTTSLYACMVTSIWQGVPYFALMLTAGLSGIPQDLYEAGAVDGTTKWQAFWYITLPSLKNIIFITTLLRTIWIANNVDLIYLMTSGGPANSSMTMSVLAFITAQKGFDFGYASAMSVTLSACLVVVAIFYVKKMNMGGNT